MNTNLGDLFRRRAFVSPDAEAIVDLAADKRYSFSRINQRINKLCHALTGLGVKQGDRIAVLTYNSVEFVDSFYAAAKLGAVAVPLNWRLVADELSFILRDCSATTLIYGTEFAEIANDLQVRGAPGTSVANWIEVGPADTRQPWALNYDDLVADCPASEPDLTGSDDDLMFIMYTSGTTGSPKGVMHSHRTICAASHNVLSTIDLGQRDRYLIVLPLFHVGALTPLLSCLYGGSSVTLMRQFDPAAMWQVMAKERISSTLAVPAMLNFMLMVPDFQNHDLSALRYILSGASPVPVALIQKYQALGIDIEQVYGMTETGGPGCYIGGKDAVERAGSTGRGYMLTEVRVADSEGRDVPPGEPGEILLRGDHNMVGYWNRPEATAETLRGGWLHTGDMAIMDKDGFVTIHDRIKDMVISGGENVYPAEIENIILQHDGVADVAVIGQSSEAWGESTFAVVVRSDENTTAADIQRFCDGKMASFKAPKGVAFVDEIPRNPTGKPLKRLLRDQFPGPAPE
jgi:acyl-CoA synthetase (AMP-forming)/AMP-acid ligase II